MVKTWRQLLYWVGLCLGSIFMATQLVLGVQALSELRVTSTLLASCFVAMLIGLAGLGLQMLAWHWLMQGLGVSVGLRGVAQGYMLSFLPRYVPGSIWGYFSRSEWLHQNYQVPHRMSNAGAVIEVALALSTGLLIVTGHEAWARSPSVQLLFCTFLLSFPIIIWLVMHRLEKVVFSDNSIRVTVMARIFNSISFGRWIRLFISYVLLWLCYGMVTAIIVQVFEPSDPLSKILPATFSFTLSWLIGFFIIFIPAGIGIREITLSRLLVVIFGLSLTQSSAVAVLTRLCILAAEGTWILVGFLFS